MFLAASLVSRCVREGHIFLDLNDHAGKIVFRSEDGENIIECPPIAVMACFSEIIALRGRAR